MKWTILTENNIPDCEVLALGYQKEMIIGYISEDDDDSIGFVCDSDGEQLTEVTHFIKCKDLLKLITK